MKERYTQGHKIFREWHWMPTAIFILGALSTVMLFGIYRIGERQRISFDHVDAVMDLQIKTAVFHLWFEEAITDGSREDLERTFADLDGAMKLSDALLYGGESEHGTALPPLDDPAYREYAESIRALLVSLKEIALKRYQDPGASGIGSAIEEQFDAVFREFQERARALESAAEKNQMSYQARTGRLLFIIAVIWIFIVAGSTAGLYNREHRRRRAELALKKAYAETEQEVNIRTAELANANSQLREEIDERKRIGDSLRESESEFRRLSLQFHTLLDAIPDSISLVSSDLRVLWANRGAASADKFSGATGQYCYTLWHGASGPCDGCPALRGFQTGKEEHLQFSKADGKIWELRAFPMWSENGRIENVIEIATDVTEKITLQAETLRTAHLASIGELAAGVAHEINNPINGIINYARILSNKSTRGSIENDVAERISTEGRRIAGIVKSLLSFARERKKEKKPVGLESILRESLTLTESQLRKEGIQLRVDLPPDLPEIIANQQQIQQVFMNIISNAQYALSRKYPGEDKDKMLDIICEEITTDMGPFVRITFHDRGIGMAPDVMDKIMNPFYTTKPMGEGTGLGLSISHGIVTDHGGRLTVKSVKGEYTKILIDLPAKERDG